MAGRLERLMLRVGLLDRITGPLNRIQNTITQVTNNSRRAFMNTAAGAMALVAATSSFAATVNPANDLNNAVGEVRSLGVVDSTLDALNQSSLKYSIQFGEHANTYVRSAYDIQSAIDGLVDNDLPRFTTAAGTLAKATKANVSDISSYFGSMYGIFKNQANEIGKAKWVENLAGQTATAVQMFKTTGPEMKAAFESVGAGAQTMGVKLNEQMAVLGTLQATMSGSEAGTKYRAFLDNLPKAQDKLGLNFSDESGKLLPIVDILNTIEGKFGAIDTLGENATLKKAFGSAEAVGFIKLLSADVNKLGGDIDKLGQVKGMEKAVWMAEQMNDPWARLSSGIQAVSIAIFQKALPVIEPYINKITQLTSLLVDWTAKYPHLSKAIGLVIFGFMALVAAGGVLALGIGLVQFASVGLTLAMNATGLSFILNRSKILLFSIAIHVAKAAMWSFILFGPAVATFFATMKVSFLTTLPAVWAFTAALLANPITWIVIGIAALIAALVAVVVYWDDVTAAINRFTNYVFDSLAAGWNWIKNLFAENEWLKLAFWPIFLAIEFVESLVTSFDLITQWWGEFSVWFAGLAFFPNFSISTDLFEPLKAWWMDFKNWLGELDPFAFLGDSVDWMKDKLSWIPGIELDSTTEVKQKVESEQASMNSLVSLPGTETTKAESEGGLFQTFSNLFSSSSKQSHVEKIEVNNYGQGVRGDELAHEMEMQVG